MELGERIKARRARLGLTLDALKMRTNVSRAMLSEIERGTKNPTIKVVCLIAEGLNCTVSELLGEVAESTAEIAVVRHYERQLLVDPRSGVERSLLSPSFQRRGLEVLAYVIPPGGRTGALPPHRPGVAEHITVVAGVLHCILGDEELILAVGDSVSFAANRSHAFHNPGPQPCHYFLIIDSSQRG